VLTDTELIRKLDLFEGLNPKTIQRIAELCIVREFTAEDYIIRQGESGLGLYFITAGRVKVELERNIEVPEGTKSVKVVLNELTEGGVVGEFSIIDDKARSANVICLEETRCLLLTRDSFSKLLKKHPEIALQMLKSLVARIRSTNERIGTSSGIHPAPAAAAPAPSPAEPPSNNSSNPLDGVTAVAGRITEMIPRPEDMIKMYSSTKDRVQGMVVGMFGTMYVVKAMTRFSMAMVGCPVTVKAEKPGPEVIETVIEGIKVVLFPARLDQTIRIEAYADGELSATVFRPGRSKGLPEVEAIRWEGPVRQQESFELHVPARVPPGASSPHELARKSPRPCRLVPTADSSADTIRPRSPWCVRRAFLRDGVPIAAPESESGSAT